MVLMLWTGRDVENAPGNHEQKWKGYIITSFEVRSNDFGDEIL